MTRRVQQNPHRIASEGAQVVSLQNVTGAGGRTLHPRGSVGVVRSPGDFDHSDRVRFPDGMDEGPFGDAETLSRAKNTAVNGLVEAGIVAARAGKVRLVRRDELPADWNPAADNRIKMWEVTQHLIQRLDQQGETGAAELVRQLGNLAEVARDLAYRLYSTCERRKWAQEALAYNSLVVAWPELTRLALAARTRPPEIQTSLEFDT